MFSFQNRRPFRMPFGVRRPLMRPNFNSMVGRVRYGVPCNCK